MSRLVRISTCNLNQWALDFDGNLERIKESIRIAKKDGSKFRLGPELELSGYSCEDHFLEHDTILHCWESLVDLLVSDENLTYDILCDIGMPIIHRDVCYNCRIFLLNGQILGIRPKLFLANDGNYRETRWFTEWSNTTDTNIRIEEFYIPDIVLNHPKITKNHPKTVPIGCIVLRCGDATIGSETCEELFTPVSPHISMSLDGVEIITNGSGSHHQLRKLTQRIDLIKSATKKSGGVYLYANQLGCDGGRLFFDGSCMIWENGNLVKQGSQFGLGEVEVLTATVNLNEVNTFRTSFKSRSTQAAASKIKYPRIDISYFYLGGGNNKGVNSNNSYNKNSNGCSSTTRGENNRNSNLIKSKYIDLKIHNPMEEIAFGPSAWLWDYLRRSGQRGYFLPLSGGMDSGSTCLLVGIMCDRLYNNIKKGGILEVEGSKINNISEVDKKNAEQHLADLRKITKNPKFIPRSGRHICENIFWTCYMASQYSGAETRRRAVQIAKLCGANHCSIYIDEMTSAIQNIFQKMKVEPTTESCSEGSEMKAAMKIKRPEMGGSGVENIALQNIQARSRMVMSYFLAQLMPFQVESTKNEPNPWPGTLLVLGSANVDEALRGYYTKYDCSAADINPIGGIKKVDLKSFLLWGHNNIGKKIFKTLDIQYESFVETTKNRRFTATTTSNSNITKGDIVYSNVLLDTAIAEPSAELTGAEGDQKDEVDMGMSYAELGDLGNARKCAQSGPLTTFERMYHDWSHYYKSCSEDDHKDADHYDDNGAPPFSGSAIANGHLEADQVVTHHQHSMEMKSLGESRKKLTPSKRHNGNFSSYAEEVGQKVKDFYFYHAINRHKMTTLTPAYHAENYSPEDNRFDLRPFLYPANFTRQFQAIDKAVKEIEENHQGGGEKIEENHQGGGGNRL